MRYRRMKLLLLLYYIITLAVFFGPCWTWTQDLRQSFLRTHSGSKRNMARHEIGFGGETNALS